MMLQPFMPWLEVRKAKARGDLSEVERLLAEYDGLAPKARKAFLDAIKALQDSIDIRAIAQFLREGNIRAAIEAVTLDSIALAVKPLSATLAQGLIEAARAAMRRVPVPGALQATFTVSNPNAMAFLQGYEFGLIRELTQEARAAVAATIRAGVDAGRNPLDTARDVRANIGLTSRQAAAVANYRRLLETGHADALQRALRDRRFDASVARAIQGKDLAPEQIERMVARYQARYLKYRSEVIARTESIRAVNAGNQLGWRQAVDDGTIPESSVRRFWIYTKDNKTRPAHRRIPGMNPKGVGLEQPFQTPLGPLMYPGDPSGEAANIVQCRCAMVIRYVASRADFDDVEPRTVAPVPARELTPEPV